MTLQSRFLIPTLSGVLMIGMLPGCEDSSANQRDALQKTIADATREMQSALATSGVNSEDTAEELQSKQQKLSSIVSKLNGSDDGGQPGQIAAKSMLAAAALREIATIQLAKATRVEGEHRTQRVELREKLNAIMSLQSLASGIESADARAERDKLTADLESAKAHAAQLAEKLTTLDGPISEQTTLVAAAQSEVDTLKLEVDSLRKKANELGHADGFETYKRSAAIRRNADRIELDIAQREIDLDYTLTPEHKLVGTQLQQIQASSESIQAALDLLSTFSQTSSDSIKDIRARSNEFSDEIAQGIEAINRSTTDNLKPAYDEALDSLDKAAKKAESAVRQLKGDDVNAARLMAAKTRASRGDVYWSLARGASDQASLLEGLKAAGNTSAASGLDAVQSAHKEAIDLAKAEYAAAQELLAQVQSRESQAVVDSFRQNLTSAADALEGKAAAKPEVEASSDSDADAPRSASTSKTFTPRNPGSFADADDLFSYIKSIPRGIEGMRASNAVSHAETDLGRQVIKANSDMAEAFAKIDGAMRKKFKKGLFEGLGAMLAASMPDMSKLKVGERTDDKLSYSISVIGMTINSSLRKVDGSWWIDADDIDPQIKPMMEMQLKTADAMAQAADDIVARIESGELKNPQEVLAAFGQAAAGASGAPMP